MSEQLSKTQKRAIARTLAQRVSRELLRIVDESPAEWDGHEIREMLRGVADDVAGKRIDRRSARFKNLKNICLNKCWPRP